MSYHIPSNDDLIKIIIDYNLDANPFITTNIVSEGLNKLQSDIKTAINIANLNSKTNREYVQYLNLFRRYVQISYDNSNSLLRIKLDNHYKLKELHKLL